MLLLGFEIASAENREDYIMEDAKRKTKLPDISQCKTTKEKIATFLKDIDDPIIIDRIYVFIKYMYFKS